MNRFAVPAALAVVVTVVAALALGPAAYPVLGLDDPGVVVRLLLPVLRVATTAAAAACLGSLVHALVLAPRRTGTSVTTSATRPPDLVGHARDSSNEPGPGDPVDGGGHRELVGRPGPGDPVDGGEHRGVAHGPDRPDAIGRAAGAPPSVAALRTASVAAAVWAATALVTAIASVADAAGGRVTFDGDLVVGLLVRAVPVGWLATAVLAAGVAVAAREVRTWSAGLGVATLAVVALLGPVVTGHAVDGVNHDIGLPATAAHVVAATLWLGTLGAALLSRDAEVWRRAARVTVPCAIVTVLAGLVSAAVLVPSLTELFTPYGLLVLVAAPLGVVALALAVLARSTGAPVQLALLGVTTALSVAMSRAVPPVQAPGHANVVEAVLGYDLPDPPGVVTLLTAWRPELWFTPLALLLAVLYAVGLRRVRRARDVTSLASSAGDVTSRARAACWFAGCALLVVAASSGLGRYGPAMLSVHVAGHMLAAVAVPILLVLGGPLTLARAALGQEARARLEELVASPTVRLATHPLVATVAVVGSPFLLYLTPLFSLTQPIGWIQPLLRAWFLATGLAFFATVLGVDAMPRRPPHVARLALLLASMPFHAVFGVLLLAADRPVSQTPTTLVADGGGGQVFVTDFYARLRLPWAPDLLADQHLAAALSWAMGDLPLVAAIVVLLVQWSRASAAEDRAAREQLLSA